jgi:hypothetical protein
VICEIGSTVTRNFGYMDLLGRGEIDSGLPLGPGLDGQKGAASYFAPCMDLDQQDIALPQPTQGSGGSPVRSGCGFLGLAARHRCEGGSRPSLSVQTRPYTKSSVQRSHSLTG